VAERVDVDDAGAERRETPRQRGLAGRDRTRDAEDRRVGGGR
jgi:hypothetical protein